MPTVRLNLAVSMASILVIAGCSGGTGGALVGGDMSQSMLTRAQTLAHQHALAEEVVASNFDKGKDLQSISDSDAGRKFFSSCTSLYRATSAASELNSLGSDAVATMAQCAGFTARV